MRNERDSYKPRYDPTPKATLYVTGFIKGTSAKALASAFERYGPLAQVNVLPPRRSDGEQYGFVAFRRINDMNAVLRDLDEGKILDNGLALTPEKGLLCQKAKRLPNSNRDRDRERKYDRRDDDRGRRSERDNDRSRQDSRNSDRRSYRDEDGGRSYRDEDGGRSYRDEDGGRRRGYDNDYDRRDDRDRRDSYDKRDHRRDGSDRRDRRASRYRSRSPEYRNRNRQDTDDSHTFSDGESRPSDKKYRDRDERDERVETDDRYPLPPPPAVATESYSDREDRPPPPPPTRDIEDERMLSKDEYRNTDE